MVRRKLALKEQPTEEGSMPVMLPGLGVMVTRQQECGWLEIPLHLSACGQGISRKEPSRQYHDMGGRLYGEGAFRHGQGAI